MSRIDDLIAELCPDGVEFKTLGEVLRIKNGKDHKALADGDIPVYGSGGIMRYVETAAAVGPSVLIPRKGSLGNLFFVEGPFWVVDTIFRTEIDASIVDPKFVYHQLLTMGLGEMNQAGGVPSQTQSVLNLLRIPVPPLEVQREIVRILDQFTALEAELEARRRQYQHYRSSVLSDIAAGDPTVSLGDVVDLLVGFSFKSSGFVDDGSETALVRGDNIGQGFLKTGEFKRWQRGEADSLESYALSVHDIVLAMDRPFIPAGLKWASITQDVLPALLVQRVARLRSDARSLDQQFLRQVISSAAFVTYVRRSQTGNTVPHISAKQIADFQFVLPTVSEQRRIVEILDKFDALVNDLSVGLPAELAARRKQYEYYRDRLLTFKEAA